MKIPVNVERGGVLIPEHNINNLCIPESIAYARYGFCEIPFEEDRQIDVKFKEQIDVEPLINIKIHKPETTSTDLDINKVIRTNHLNPEKMKF